MRISIKNTILIVFGVFMVSCTDYLDVQPEDKYIEDQVYASKGGINTILNGIYINMAKPQLYGGNLTMSTVEILGQSYNLSNNAHVWRLHNQYAYNEAPVKRDMNAIWTSSYAAILNVNNLLSGLGTQIVLTPTEANIINGEALGLRAMLHFDLLRLFGPIYTVDSSNLSIPYYKEAQASANPLLPASEVIENVLADLDKAATLLKDDPIVSNGVSGDESDSFYSNRNLRLNFYAIKALQARVYLYAGNNQAAFDAATMVIDASEAEGIFPWTPPIQVVTGSNPDRVFSSEVIFGVENLKLYEQQNGLFSSDLSGSNILAPNNFRLRETFENNENDYRYNSSWLVPSAGSFDFRTFFKYAPLSSANSRFLQPLIRKTELYYIAAETSSDPTQALAYLNAVRFNRGLIDLSETANIQDELLKEYKKEFYGEGQLFFYYKRINMDKIPDGTKTSVNFKISMDSEKYVVPLPDSETQFNN